MSHKTIFPGKQCGTITFFCRNLRLQPPASSCLCCTPPKKDPGEVISILHNTGGGRKSTVAPPTATSTETLLCSLLNKQPIMRIEDRLFDRGWVRSAMATRKCGNIFFPKYFMAVRPFLARIFFQELFGLVGSKLFLEKNRQVHNLKISDRLLRSKS